MTLLLAAVAVLGHLVLLVGTHNWFYGLRLPKWASKLVHLIHLIAFLALPTALLLWPAALESQALRPYLILCVLAAVVLLPLVTALRALRRDLAADATSEVVTAAPGRGFLARLPFNEIHKVEYRTFTLCPPRLPAALDGLTILHLTDLHFHGTPGRDYFDAVVRRCNEWKPDVVAVTGDVVDSERHHRWILPVLGRLRWNVAGFAILGNHDHRFDPTLTRRRLRRIGLRVLPNTWEALSVRGTEVTVIGHEGPWLRPPPDLSGCPADTFRLCLSHTPDNAPWAARHGVDVVLSGHVHGGQIRLPLVGPVFMPSAYGRRYDHGVYQVGPTLLCVSRGLSGEHPVRYNCLPEVSLITLRAKEPARA